MDENEHFHTGSGNVKFGSQYLNQRGGSSKD